MTSALHKFVLIKIKKNNKNKTPRQAIKLCAHDLVNEIHEIKTAKHFIYTVIYIGETLAHFNRLQLWICQIVHNSATRHNQCKHFCCKNSISVMCEI